jgi:DNA polymerase-3 subunit epsilon
MGVAEDSFPAPEAAPLPQDLIFVDLETTGGNAACHRVTEVGIVRMEAGRVVEEWSALVNPECLIPSYIEAFTGITNEMVAAAPRFADLADLILGKLSSSDGLPSPVFVAHNARFDYAFLRAEFARVGVRFSASVLCTVKLSRRLYPEFARHNLDAIMERHDLSCAARHRALGDAQVLAAFWSKLSRDIAEARLAAAVHTVLAANRLPPYLPEGLANDLPDGPGVYRFFDGDGALLYIGRSASLRARVLGHFAADNADAKEQKKALKVRRIDWVETAGILGAQLLEAQWLKSQRPSFNRRVKPGTTAVTLRVAPVAQMSPDARTVRIVAIDELEADALAGCFGIFHSHKDARKALIDIARAHSLCLKVAGLEEADGSCLGYPLGQCKGACVGKESLVLHNLRLQLALSALKLKPWPFPGRIALIERRSAWQDASSWQDASASPAEHADFHVLDQWTYLGTARSADELAGLSMRVSPVFDADVYRILARYLEKNPAVAWRDLRAPIAGALSEYSA